jgi:peptidoglycan/LPS O-acetylase OafA/YrhL
LSLPATDPTPPKRPEFPYLDGLRGLSAVLVVLYHSYLFTGLSGESRAELPMLKEILGWGYLGVPVFIVLSGYVLMLPILSTPGLKFRHGVWSFIKRRGKRILPPYYAALVFSLLLIALFPVLQEKGGTQWDSKIPVTWGSTISHFLMLHDFNHHWIGKINGPLWSVAVEWHIYFLMPLLLLPLWRRIHPAIIVGALTAASFWLLAERAFGFVHPWLVALFAAGMWAAQLTMRQQTVRAAGPVFILLAAATVGCAVFRSDIPLPTRGLMELMTGLAVAAGLVWLGRRAVAGRIPRGARLLQTRPMLFLGLISYSVYLFHSPLLGLANLLLLPLDLSLATHWAIMTFAVMPAVLVLCWLFFLLVERHFLNTRQRHTVEAHDSAGQPDTGLEDAPAVRN